MNRDTYTGWAQVAIVAGFLAVTAFSPHDYFTWFLEVSWVLVGFVVLAILRIRNVTVSQYLGWALFVHALILIYGGWYTYELVPLGDWASNAFGWQRNHYDRLGHFAQGFLPAFLYREILVRNRVVNGFAWREGIVFAMVMAFTGIFEIIEFAAAKAFGADANAYLGSQGDIWDAQWDMVFCGIGGLLSILLFSKSHANSLLREDARGS